MITTNLFLAIASLLTTQGCYPESEGVLSLVRSGGDHANYLHLINNVALNRKADVNRYGRDLLDSFTFADLPRRHRVLTEQIMHELEQWQPDGLDDIVREMRKSRNYLVQAQAGKRTQDIQREIVAKLDRLIKNEEDKLKAPADLSQPNNTQPSPAPDSIIMGGAAAKGAVDERRIKQVAESWGTLPPQQRQRVIEEITRELPSKYKKEIEEYHRRLLQLKKSP